MMGQTTHHYLIFETASGFCGIAWNGVGITCLQLPTKSATRCRTGSIPAAFPAKRAKTLLYLNLSLHP
jgi:methylated-DNA-[protein]-cysteine S-methyltransferase